MSVTLAEWAARWWTHLPPQAQAEFDQLAFPQNFVEPDKTSKSESAVQADIRLAASSEFRAPLWRNNSGAGLFEDPNSGAQQMVRFGLGNDSVQLNKKWKSSDLIGIRPTVITPELVGRTLGVFLAVEVKKPGWKLLPSDKRGNAQANFMNSVASFGGLSGFAQSVDDLRRILTHGPL